VMFENPIISESSGREKIKGARTGLIDTTSIRRDVMVV
jgi:hypothetical protein